ncbi:MAG: chemotaxis protein CheR, partial [Cyanobacteria bacterium J083]
MNPPRFQVTIIWQELIQLIQAISGISLKETTINNLKNYINQRINQLNIDLTDYYKLLKSSEPLKSAEWHNVIDKITNNESYFFRDHAQFQLLKNQIIPQIIKQQKLAKSITICSGGCSTGEEPLSLA